MARGSSPEERARTILSGPMQRAVTAVSRTNQRLAASGRFKTSRAYGPESSISPAVGSLAPSDLPDGNRNDIGTGAADREPDGNRIARGHAFGNLDVDLVQTHRAWSEAGE